MAEYEGGVNLDHDEDASIDLGGSDEQKDGDIERGHVFSRVRSWLYDESAEDELAVLPRADGRKSSPWRSQDIGFFLPSHYFEREDGQTPRSMAVPQSEWESAVDGMDAAVQRLAEADQYSNLVGGPEVSSQRRMAAAAVFLADIFEGIDDVSNDANLH